MAKRSLASFLTRLVDVAWYLTVIGVVLAICLLAVSPWVDPPRVEVGLALPVAFTLDADAYRVAAPALGVETARIQGINGSLRFSPRSAGSSCGSFARSSGRSATAIPSSLPTRRESGASPGRSFSASSRAPRSCTSQPISP